MTEKQSDTKETPIEELQCHKKYVYDTGIIFECKNNCKSEIIGEDVVDLLNELTTKCSQLKKENEQLKTIRSDLISELDIVQNELNIAIDKGFAPSKSYKNYMASKKTEYDKFWENKIKTHNNRLKELLE